MTAMPWGSKRWGATAAIVVAVALALAGVAISLRLAAIDNQSMVTEWFNAVVVASFAVVGAVVVAARPLNRVGWLMMVGGACWALGGAGVDLAYHGIVAKPGSVPAVAAFAVLGASVRGIGWYLEVLAVPMFFPDGEIADARWRRMPRVLIVVFVASVIDPLTDKQADLTNLGSWQNPIALGQPWDIVSGVAFLLTISLGALVFVTNIRQLIFRWRTGDAVRRQQLVLFAWAAALPVLAVPLVFATTYSAGNWIFGLTALPLPFAIGFAVLARGLYDLRATANRGLVWVTLSAVVAALYATVIVAAAAVFNVDRTAAALTWGAAGVIAVAIVPLRDSLQRAINRLTYGRWDEPYDVLASLGSRLAATVQLERLLDNVIDELTGLGLGAVSIRDASGLPLAGDHDTTRRDVVNVPLTAYGHVVGTMTYQPTAAPLRPRDQKLLDDLTGPLGAVLHAHRLTLDLQRARERLVVAGEEERRRLRRDLHDGLGPALAGHLLRLDALGRTVASEPALAAEVATLRHDLHTTMLDVRRLVEGLRPPALDDLGLVGALQHAITRLAGGAGIRTEVDAAPMPPLPAAVEVAAYRIVTEAVTNVARHAGASACHVSLAVTDDTLRAVIWDDGRGLSPADPAGNGMQTMRERAEELRGRLAVTTNRGTTLVAELPLGVVPRQPNAGPIATIPAQP